MILKMFLILLEVCAHPVVNHNLNLKGFSKTFQQSALARFAQKAQINAKYKKHHKPASWMNNANEELKGRVEDIEQLIDSIAMLLKLHRPDVQPWAAQEEAYPGKQRDNP